MLIQTEEGGAEKYQNVFRFRFVQIINHIYHLQNITQNQNNTRLMRIANLVR